MSFPTVGRGDPQCPLPQKGRTSGRGGAMGVAGTKMATVRAEAPPPPTLLRPRTQVRPPTPERRGRRDANPSPGVPTLTVVAGSRDLRVPDVTGSHAERYLAAWNHMDARSAGRTDTTTS